MKKPPVSCGGCGREITFEPGQLVGDPGAVEAVKEIMAERDRLYALAVEGGLCDCLWEDDEDGVNRLIDHHPDCAVHPSKPVRRTNQEQS